MTKKGFLEEHSFTIWVCSGLFSILVTLGGIYNGMNNRFNELSTKIELLAQKHDSDFKYLQFEIDDESKKTSFIGKDFNKYAILPKEISINRE